MVLRFPSSSISRLWSVMAISSLAYWVRNQPVNLPPATTDPMRPLMRSKVCFVC